MDSRGELASSLEGKMGNTCGRVMGEVCDLVIYFVIRKCAITEGVVLDHYSVRTLMFG